MLFKLAEQHPVFCTLYVNIIHFKQLRVVEWQKMSNFAAKFQN